MSRKAIKSINWSGIAEKIMEREKPQLAAFKAKSDQYMRRMMANPEQLPKIDWSYYEKNIPVAGLVEQFRKSYESVQVPYPEDKYTQLIDQEEKEGLREIEDFIKASNERIEECKQKIEKYSSLKPLEEMSLEEYYEVFPRVPINTPDSDVERIRNGLPPEYTGDVKVNM